jgi:hypothetical protein
MSYGLHGNVPPPPPLPPPARRWWPWVLGSLVFIAIVITAVIYRPFPTDEEKKYFGWWYGSEFNDTNHPRAWVAHFREDGRLEVAYGEYWRDPDTKKWVLTAAEELGSWRIKKGVQCLASENPKRPPGWWERIERLQNTGDWRRVHYYRTTEINEREMRYESVTDGHEFRALRSTAAVPLPPEPLPPEKWKGSTPAR